jgi:ABC-type antimicrobial peptide transport system permease subunit
MALGATRSKVTLMVLKSAFALVIAGFVVALPLAFWSERTAMSLVENLPPTTAVPAAFVALSMISLAMVAAYVPARRAAGVDPAEALRHE